ncbi:MAG: FAD-dependent oxidoreductase [Deltaproteobacteria bacterium]|nr:FAD-dependent oxidoreductase [Deltaproteobacteria bacterium]MBW2318238.1 FAD-dependent oxidoreductase [Deltaproteobacteria bacterium]
MVKIEIDGKKVEARDNATVLEAALEAGTYIPNLCYHPDLESIGACRLCIVEIEGMRGLPPSCTVKVRDDMVVRTNTKKLKDLRRDLVWLLLTECSKDVLREGTQFKKVVDYVGMKDILPGFEPERKSIPIDEDDPLFIRDLNLCILCGRCYRACKEIRGVSAIGLVNRGIKSYISTSYDRPLRDTVCRFCGACVEVCPTGALREKREFTEEDRKEALVPCMKACPAGIDVPRYVNLIAEKKYQDAISVIRERVPFPLSLGCVCPHPCEDVCRRCDVNEAICIKELKRFVADIDSGEWKKKITVAPNTGKKVAVVGAGPAGLTAAWFLRKKGHSVTIYDSLPKPGGMMRAGIPRYRLPDETLDREIKVIEEIGIEIKTNVKIESVDRLFDEGADVVFLAVGAPKGMKMGIPGEDALRVLDGVDVLRDINFGKKIELGNVVAVVGGGNVAVDVARSVLRSGVRDVSILYRRSREEMPAFEEEIDYAQEEGVNFEYLTAPKKVEARGEKIAVECVRMELGKPDASGRRRPVAIKGSEFSVEPDYLITAIGQRSDVPEGFCVDTDKRGRILADSEHLSCKREGVFAGGDVVSGPATVIGAIQQGRIAAMNIDKHLGGNGEIFERIAEVETPDGHIGCIEDFSTLSRASVPVIAVEKRLDREFPEVEHSLEAEVARAEANRCLRCGLRLLISKAPEPPTGM